MKNTLKWVKHPTTRFSSWITGTRGVSSAKWGYEDLFGRACINPLLDNLQLFRGKVGKMIARALHLDQKTVCRVTRNDHCPVRAPLHNAGISEHVEAPGCQITMTTRTLHGNKWTDII